MRTSALPCVGLAAAIAAFAPAQDAEAWAPHRALKVLYAGKAGGHREKVFGEFLRQWFDRAATIPYGELSEATAAGFDVVILDWMSQYENDGYPPRERGLFSPPGSFGPEFDTPMIAMSYVAATARREYKLDWL